MWWQGDCRATYKGVLYEGGVPTQSKPVSTLVIANASQLPGQQGKKLHFATAPSELDMRIWQRPNSWPCDERGRCPRGKYAVGDVFFAEVCIMNRVCQNRQSLFNLKAGELFECDFNKYEFDQLTTDFQRKVPIASTVGCRDWLAPENGWQPS